jgi:hypothetical protein
MPNALTLERMSPQLRKVAARREPCRRKSRMVEISLSGSGEGLGRATGRGYSTTYFTLAVCQDFGEDYNRHSAPSKHAQHGAEFGACKGRFEM